MTQEITKEVKELQELINNHDNIVFFGGAGVSTESGIQDFRSQDQDRLKMLPGKNAAGPFQCLHR